MKNYAKPYFCNLIEKTHIIAVFLYCLHYFILNRLFLYIYIDSDQLVMADMASFYSRGVIFEPYFWGQNYMFPIESWIATPLVIMGIRADVATMTVAAICFYSPYVIALYFFRKCAKWLKLLVFFTPLLLPIEFSIVSLMPRNFGTAAGLASLFYMLAISTNNKYFRIISMLSFGSMTASYQGLAPLFSLFFHKSLAHKRIVIALILATLGFILIFAFKSFYHLYPHYLTKKTVEISFSLNNLKNSLQNSQLVYYPSVLLLSPISIGLIVIFYHNKYIRPTILALCSAALIFGLVMLGTNKITDYQESVFFSAYRFWVWLPTFLLLSFFSIITISGNQQTVIQNPVSKSDGNIFPFAWPTRFWLLLIFTLILLAHNYNWIRSNAERMANLPAYPGVTKRDTVKQECSLFKAESKSGHYLVSVHNNFFHAYGCFTFQEVIITMREGDRRSWIKNYSESLGYSPRFIP